MAYLTALVGYAIRDPLAGSYGTHGKIGVGSILSRNRAETLCAVVNSFMFEEEELDDPGVQSRKSNVLNGQS
jgi:hypothetical protein